VQADPEVIRSRANPLLKRVRSVRIGREKDTLLLEGRRLIADAVAAGLELEVLLVDERQDEVDAELLAAAVVLRRVAPELLDRASELDTSPGWIALARAPRSPALAELALGPAALVLVTAGVSDPGNLGALARSAEAAGASALMVVAGGARPWSPKALRGSMGSLLRLPVVSEESPEQAARELAQRGLRQVVAATRGGCDLGDFDWSGPIALWVASETGAAPAVCRTFEAVTIPMRGAVESLNVAVAGSLLLFAAAREDAPRQRARRTR